MQIYENTNGFRNLIIKLTELYTFKKIEFESGDSLQSGDAVCDLYVTDKTYVQCTLFNGYNYGKLSLCTDSIKCDIINTSSSTTRWVIYVQSDLIGFGIRESSNNTSRPATDCFICNIINYDTKETEIGLVTSYANRNFKKYAVIVDDLPNVTTNYPYRLECRKKLITSFVPVISYDCNKGCTNLYHIVSHSTGAADDDSITQALTYEVPNQIVTINNKKYFLSRFAFEIKD